MKVTLLGTGTSGGVPMIGCSCAVCTSKDPKDHRLRTSALIETAQGKRILIDCGPDFRQQMLRAEIGDIDAVLFTHEHKDHTGGIDDLRAINFIQKKSVPIYAEQNVLDALRRQYDYVFAPNPYPGIPRIDLQEITDEPFSLFGIEILPIRVMHGNLPVLGFRIGDFTYVTDASFIGEAQKVKIIGTKALVVNALRLKEHVSHFNLNEALDLLSELKPDSAYLTHVSHQMGRYETISSQLPETVQLGYDGLNIYL
ncbi:MAG: phosphoribosyl 1,2-cyclic phosphate phosphodiesterase [Limisphaerales bacterium]